MLGWIILSCCVLLLLLSIVLFFSDSIRRSLEKRRFDKRVYKVLRHFADENDHLLLNQVTLYLLGDATKPVVYDHILFADKYIYVVKSFTMQGGIYGNASDPSVFLKDYKNNTQRIENPILANKEQVRKLETALSVSPDDKMFVSVIVYNPSLAVPKMIARKDVTDWFLPVTELEKTLCMAENDSVTPIRHEQTDRLALMLKKRSDETKRELEEEAIRSRKKK